MGHKVPIETFGPEGRGLATWTALTRLLLFLTVHCKARRRRLQSPIVAMALATLATSQPSLDAGSTLDSAYGDCIDAYGDCMTIA